MNKGRNILVLTYWPLRNALITTYTLPYLRIILKQLPRGSRIWLFTLSPSIERKDPAQTEAIRTLRTENIETIDCEYSRFGPGMALRFVYMTARLLRIIRSEKIKVIHAWCTPAGALGWLLSMLTGKKLVLDSFEPHAESMVEAGTWDRGSLSFRILFSLEKKQLRRAAEVICAAPGMMEYANDRYGVRRGEKYVKPACVDLDLFAPAPKSDRTLAGFGAGDIVCVYAGKFGGIYLEQETFDFFASAARFWPGRFRVLLLTGHSDAEIRGYCAGAGLDPSLVIKRFVDHAEVPRLMALGDFGICPVKPLPTKKYCSPIKNGEYWALGLPVVITANISKDSAIIAEHNAGAVLHAFSNETFTAACETIDKIICEPGHKTRIRQIATQERNFALAERVYGAIYGRMA